MNRERNLYFSLKDLEIRASRRDEVAAFDTVQQHELWGMRLMGCEIVRTPSFVQITHPSMETSYFNRTIILDKTVGEVEDLVKEGCVGAAFEVNQWGLIGSVVFEGIAGVYCCCLTEERRGTSVLSSMIASLKRELLDQGANWAYLKTRNRAAYGIARKFFGFEHLYNERVYEKA